MNQKLAFDAFDRAMTRFRIVWGSLMHARLSDFALVMIEPSPEAVQHLTWVVRNEASQTAEWEKIGEAFDGASVRLASVSGSPALWSLSQALLAEPEEVDSGRTPLIKEACEKIRGFAEGSVERDDRELKAAFLVIHDQLTNSRVPFLRSLDIEDYKADAMSEDPRTAASALYALAVFREAIAGLTDIVIRELQDKHPTFAENTPAGDEGEDLVAALLGYEEVLATMASHEETLSP